MTANERIPRWSARVWRAVRRAAALLLAAYAGQAGMWGLWCSASGEPLPDSGPLTWVLTVDSYRLAGSHVPAPGRAKTGGRP